MSKSMKHNVSYITKAAFIAALYVVLTELSAQFGLSGTNVIQFRISEALTILPFFTSAAIPGLVIGCFLSNLLTGAVIWDVIFGTVATLIGALLTYALRKYKWLAPIPPILANTIIVPFVLRYAYGFEDAWWFLGLTVFIGEFVCCGVLGMLLLFAINKRPAFILDKKDTTTAEPLEHRTFKDVFPPYVWVTFVYLLTIDLLVFYGTRPFLPHLTAHDLSTPLDAKIPFMPAWIIVYYASFLSWLISIIWMLMENKQRAYRLCGVYTIICILATICFLAYPVTMQRPEVTESGLFYDWIRGLYTIDAPVNLCPSFHVVISYLCWRGTFGCEKIPRWYRWFNFTFLILVCFSILFVKQHVMIDIGVAIVITELALQIGRLTKIERVGFAIERLFHKKQTKENPNDAT